MLYEKLERNYSSFVMIREIAAEIKCGDSHARARLVPAPALALAISLSPFGFNTTTKSTANDPQLNTK